MRNVMWAAVCSLPLLVSAGCYTYEPVQTPRPGAEVRARFTTDAAIRRSSGLDEPILYLDGRVVGAEPEVITLDVLVARSTSMFQDIVIRDTVRIEMDELQSIVARELHVGRTLLFSAAVGTGAVLAITSITSIVGGNEDDGPDPGPQPTVVPLLGLRFGAGGLRLHVPFR